MVGISRHASAPTALAGIFRCSTRTLGGMAAHSKSVCAFVDGAEKCLKFGAGSLSLMCFVDAQKDADHRVF
jgi:hypothetical protein